MEFYSCATAVILLNLFPIFVIGAMFYNIYIDTRKSIL
jgi:hypothetical protein